MIIRQIFTEGNELAMSEKSHHRRKKVRSIKITKGNKISTKALLPDCPNESGNCKLTTQPLSLFERGSNPSSPFGRGGPRGFHKRGSGKGGNNYRAWREEKEEIDIVFEAWVAAYRGAAKFCLTDGSP